MGRSDIDLCKKHERFRKICPKRRIAIGAMIIKAVLSLSDVGTAAQIQENMYRQYFLGLEKYLEEPLSDPSLLVHIRERMGKEMLDLMNRIVIVKAVKEREKGNAEKKQ